MESATPQKRCLNCGSIIDGNYCSNCGQKDSIHRITFKETILDFFSSTFLIEGPLINTTILLFKNPGKLFREFLSGRRKTYYRPVPYFILLTVLYILLRTLIKYDPLEGSFQEPNPETIDENREIFKGAAQFMVTNINNIMFFLVFFLGAFQKLFFWKKYNLAEYTAISFYMVGIYILVGSLLMLIMVFIYPIYKYFQLIFLVIYVLLSLLSLHESRSFKVILKSILVGAFSLLTYMIFGYGFSFLVVWSRS